MSTNAHPAFRGFHVGAGRSTAHRSFRGFATRSDLHQEPTSSANTGCGVPGCHAPDHRVRAAV